MTVRPRDKARAKLLEERLLSFQSEVKVLRGIGSTTARAVLVAQIIESLRRIEFAHLIRSEQIDSRRADPSSNLFDPIRAAVFRMQKGEADEAFWLVFLATHFGKHAKHGWGLVRAVYGGGGTPWTWARVSCNVAGFRKWLSRHEAAIKAQFSFSNHRKYQSLSATSKVGTGAVIRSYVEWVHPPHGHNELIQEIHRKIGQNPEDVFDFLYRSMKSVTGFGRLGRFDFLSMLGKLGIAPIDPGSAYLVGSTGPLAGARLLFSGNSRAKLSARELDTCLLKLNSYLQIGMQALEDSLCNWQKSPKRFVSFRG